MCQYLNRRDERGKRPGDLGAWASQVEMDAMALFLGVRIYLYTKYGKEWKWFKYPSNESIGDQIVLEPGNAIYLNHANQNHFEVVTKVWNCQETRSMTLCQGEESAEVSPVTSSKRKTTLNDNVEDRKKAKRERERKRYQEDEKYAQSQRDRKKTRYHTDEEHAQAERDRKKERYHTDEEHAQAERDRKKERYHTDEEHAQAERDRKKERYHTDEEHAQAERDRKKERYHTDEEHAQEKRDKTKERYHTDEEHAQAERDRKKERYHTDEEHAQEKRDKTKERYHTDEEHAQAERDRKKERYHTDEEHAQEKRDKTKERYHTDEEHAQEKRDYEKERYHTDSEQRDLKKRNMQINREKNQNLPDVKKSIGKFQLECKKGPKHACTVCHRLLFRDQVVICHTSKYVPAVQQYLTGKYVHKCTEDCSSHCPTLKSPMGKEWICHCCHGHMMKKKTVPYQAQSNRMKLPDIPPELKSLNTLESQLIAKRISFMKVAALPKGGRREL
ncbi:uncharacterized protein LOC144908820 isoform X1 [Branchiostoma floridae x Branchiostoma belcheri]